MRFMGVGMPTAQNVLNADVRGQFKIQQMAFMVLAVFIFFVMVGMFFLNFNLKSLATEAQNLQKEEALSTLGMIANMPELGCGSTEDYCLDEDKLRIMTGNFSRRYEDFWPVASIEVYKVYPMFKEVVPCPALNCNYYEVYDSEEGNLRKYSSYVSLCKEINDNGYRYKKCEIAKVLLGVKNVRE